MLYPPDHPEFESALQLAFDGCRELLALFSTCTLHPDSLGLCLMGDACPADGSTERFTARLRERGVPAITFLEGASKQEVLELLQLLKADPESVAEQGGARAWLSRSGVEHIALEFPHTAGSYQAGWESFLAVQESADRMAFEKLLALCPESCRGAPQEAEARADDGQILTWLAEALGATVAALPQDSPRREDWLRQALLVAGDLRPVTRGRLFRVSADSEPDVLSEIASLLAPQEAADIVLCYPNAVVGEASEQLGRVLQRLMPDQERARQVEPLVKAALLARGMTEESYQSVVSLILRKSLAAVARPLEPETPSGGVQRVSLLTDLLSSTSARAIQESRVDMWLELAASLGEWDGREQVVRSFAESIPVSLAERSDDGAVELLRRVDEAITSTALLPQEKRLLRERLTQACSREICRRLGRYVSREPSQKDLFLLWLLSRADGGFDALFCIARDTELPWLQAAAGTAIVRMGERSAEACYRRLCFGAPDEAIALTRALVLSGTGEGLERGLWALEHPDPLVAAGLMEALAGSGDVRAEQVLLDALHHGSHEVQSAAARSLVQHPSDQAVAALCALLRKPFGFRRIGVVKSVIEALGRIGGIECVAALGAVLKQRNLVFRAHARELRALASEALAAIPHAAAEQVLQEGATGGWPELSSLCARALELRQRLLREESSRGPAR
jgi:hypothetical protein